MKMSITMLSMIPCVNRTRNPRLNVAAVNSLVLSCGIQALGQRYVINPIALIRTKYEKFFLNFKSFFNMDSLCR